MSELDNTESSERRKQIETSQPGLLGPSASAVAAITAGAASLLMGGHASAATIIQDSFSSASNYGNNMSYYSSSTSTGLAPDTTNLPGGRYQPDSSYVYNAAAEYNTNGGNAGVNVASFRQPTAVALTLGAYDTGVLQITANILYGSTGNAPHSTPSTQIQSPSTSYTLVGFNGQTDTSGSEYDGVSPFNGGSSPSTGFTGLSASGYGALQLYSEGVAVGSAIAYGGTYNPLAPTALTYEIDTSSGAISDVSFGNSTATYNFSNTGSFANADTSYLEFGGNTPNSGTAGTAGEVLFSYINVSSVSATPEPATLGLMAIGGLGLLKRRRRGRTDAPPSTE
jgi:hypothetical protein